LLATQVVRDRRGKPVIGAGTTVAPPGPMAAVMALVFLFVLASVGVMVKIALGSLTITTGFAMVCFSAMAIGVFVGAFRLVKEWEGEP
jgi:hypothetical protein